MTAIRGDIHVPERFGRMVGQSPAMLELFGLLRRAAASDATVLIDGETGTGKEVSALSIHENGPRCTGPFIVVDCGAIPGSLMESELFGYERGAFTGAVTARIGAFEAANGGTIFLDEIGELTLDLQPKLLRALEGRQVKRIGSNSYVPVDVRVIAATNRSLRDEVAARRFRADLYYRIAVLHVKLPALRERMMDLEGLVNDSLLQLGVFDSQLREPIAMSAFLESLKSYPWPGNIRQLRNHVERWVALGEGAGRPGLETSLPPPPLSSGLPSLRPARLPTIAVAAIPSLMPSRPASLGPPIDVDLPLKVAREQWNNDFESRYLSALLRRHRENVTAAARAAGVNRVHLYRLLRKHGLRDSIPSTAEDL